MTRSICLNADLGELPGEAGRQLDAEMLKVVTRCNVACGGHAGDDASMRATVLRALENGVRIGAHPSYPDRENFGRRSLGLPLTELKVSLQRQVADLQAVVSSAGATLSHLKAHGALYNDAARDAALANLIAETAREAGIPAVIGPPTGMMADAARRAGLDYLPEAFADRTYEPDGSLTPRSIEGAVITAPDNVLQQTVRLAIEHLVATRGGGDIRLDASTICLHSDTPGAAGHARAIRSGLEAAGVRVRA